MSNFTEVQVDMKDFGLLKRALLNMGYKEAQIETYDSPQTLNGYHRNDTASMIIRKKNLNPHSYNDLGFKKTQDGTIKVIGDTDFVTTRWLGQLKDEYALATVENQVVDSGFFINDVKRSNGQIEVTLENPYS